MASPLKPGDVQMNELTCHLKYALHVLEEETLKQVRTNLTMVKTNRVECEGLANVYQAGVEKIATLVPMVLQWRENPSIVEPIEEVESLSWLLLSLAEIERCMQSGGCYILSCVELLDSDIGNISMSRMISSLVREFSFSLDLVQAVLLCKHRRHERDGLESLYEWRDLAAELLVHCRPSELFEWCERRRRPALKQCYLDLGQELWQFSALVGEAAYEAQGHLGHPENNCKPDLASVLDELTVQPSDSLPLRVDHQDLQDQKHLGQGSYGTVFTCKWHGHERVVKIIQLYPGHLECEKAFEREVSILASLRHPNAVQTFGFGYTEGRAQGFYVMEQMQTDLSTLIRAKKESTGKSLVFPIDVSMDIISQIVEGLCALKLQRVIHLDLKPANILVNRPDESTKPFERFYRVKLADFGTSKVRDGGHSVFSTLRVGTRSYMAPEVMAATLLPEASGEHGYSWKADVYSFGLVCSEILTGVDPFGEYKRIETTLAAVRGGERPDLPLDAGHPLRRLIEDCWKLNPEERPDVWEVRQRLWDCRVFHFFHDGEPINKLANVLLSTGFQVLNLHILFDMVKTLQCAGVGTSIVGFPSKSWNDVEDVIDMVVCSCDLKPLFMGKVMGAPMNFQRRVNMKKSETSSGVGSSSPISGNEEREQAPLCFNSFLGALQLTELMEDVINIARLASGRGCNRLCTKLANVLSSIEESLASIMEILTKSRLQRLCLADKERLRRFLTESVGSLRAVAGYLRWAGVRVHRCVRNSIATSRLFGLLSSEMLSVYVNVMELAVGLQGPAIMPTREQVSAAMDRIQFDPHSVHISVCGTSGSGISSFIKNFCGLGDGEFGAARVGVTHCTSGIARYKIRLNTSPVIHESLWFYDVPGAGSTMASPEGQYFNDQGLFVFDAIFLVYDARFLRTDVEIIKTSLRFNIPVFVVRNKADQHIANMIRVETGVEPGDKGSYNKVYQEKTDKYVQATRSEFKDLMAATAKDPEMDLRHQELLLKQQVYIVSSKSSKTSQSESWWFPGSQGNRNKSIDKFIDEHSLHVDLLNFLETDFSYLRPPFAPVSSFSRLLHIRR